MCYMGKCSIWLMEPGGRGPVMMTRKVQGDRLMNYRWQLFFELLRFMCVN